METMNWMNTLHPESPIREYLEWMGRSGNDALFAEKYAAIAAEAAGNGSEKPFLTVVIRTQGNRMEMLQDTLTCLEAQSEQGFEVIIVCHRTTEEKIRQVRTLAEKQVPAFARRIRVVTCDSGERGAPLNLGFALARGEYAVCLDDDDLVFDNWAGMFREGSKTHPGMIQHAMAVTQKWKAVQDSRTGRQLLRAAGSPDTRYCKPYRTLGQQRENSCPFMGLAFPLFLFRERHILFSEELTTTEDWDYLLRTAGIAGVHDVGEVTAVYRLWNTVDASRQRIREPEWKDNYQEIGHRLSRMPLLLTGEEAAECRQELMGLESAGQKGRSSFFREAVLFWSSGEGFSDAQHMVAPVEWRDGWIRIRFTLKGRKDTEHITRLRIDPSDETMFTLSHVRIRVTDASGETLETDGKEIRETNALTENGRMLFLAEDPRMVINLPEGTVPELVELTAQVTFESPPLLTAWAEDLCADARWLDENRSIAHLFLDRGDGFVPEVYLECGHTLKGEEYRAVFRIPEKWSKGIRRLRFDPTEAGLLMLRDLEVRIEREDGQEELLPEAALYPENGFTSGDGTVFIDRDPYFRIAWKEEREIRQVTATGKLRWLAPEEMEDLFAQADAVPNYVLVLEQMNRLRKERQKEEELISDE